MWSEGALREIRTFLTLAEELHFSRTAARLGLTHARISQQIRELECRVGGRLFERTSRQVRLTPLGVELAERLSPAHARLVGGLERAAASSDQVAGVLRIGVTVTTDVPAVHTLIDTFRRQHRECAVSLEEVSFWEPYEPLHSGQIDVLCNWLAVDEPDLTVGPVIERYERVLAVGLGHRLARRRSVSLDDLAAETTNRAPRGYPRALEDAIHPLRTRSGRPIRRADEADTPAEVAARVARGEIVCPTMADLRPWNNRDGIVLIPFSDLPPMPLGLIWCTAHENARIRALAQLASAMAEPATRSRPADACAPSEEHAVPPSAAPTHRRTLQGAAREDVQLSEIRAFLVLAEELHFARTAERVGLTHSRASQLIRTLEARIGGRLFERTSRRVRLTPLGEQLRADLEPAYGQLQRALEDTRTSVGGVRSSSPATIERVLRIGFVATIPGEYLTELVDAFEARHPDCKAVLVEHVISGDEWDIWKPLRRGETDVLVYFNGFEPASEPDLTIGPTLQYRDRVLLVARDHPLASLPSVSVEQLASEHVLRKRPTLPASIMDLIVPPTTPAGQPIKRTEDANSFQEMMTLVARGRMVHPTAEGNVLTRRTDILSVPLHGLPPLAIGLIWRTAHETPDIEALAKTARALTRDTGRLSSLADPHSAGRYRPPLHDWQQAER
jgi:DNA-binding transcriptional LysR family regulator